MTRLLLYIPKGIPNVTDSGQARANVASPRDCLLKRLVDLLEKLILTGFGEEDKRAADREIFCSGLKTNAADRGCGARVSVKSKAGRS